MISSKTSKKKILLTVPSLNDLGGVASFYKAVLPHFPPSTVVPLEIGGTRNAGGLLHPIVDQIRFRLAVRRENPGLVHLNPSLGMKSFIRDGLFAWQAKRLGCPLLIFWHGWDKNFEAVMEKRYLGFFRRFFGRADGFIVLASEFERKLRSWGVTAPVYLGSTTVDENLLHGFDLETKIERMQQTATKKILFLARLERVKGVFETIDAFETLLKKGYDVNLTIAGDGTLLNDVKEYAKKNKIPKNRLSLPGYVEGYDKIKVFKEHDIYCLPTYGEGMPISVLEAMAFGMPIITRPVGGLNDFFKNGKMGFLANSKTSGEISNLLEKLICNKKLLSEIGRYNYYYAKDNFMASTVAEKLIKTYKFIL